MNEEQTSESILLKSPKHEKKNKGKKETCNVNVKTKRRDCESTAGDYVVLSPAFDLASPPLDISDKNSICIKTKGSFKMTKSKLNVKKFLKLSDLPFETKVFFPLIITFQTLRSFLHLLSQTLLFCLVALKLPLPIPPTHTSETFPKEGHFHCGSAGHRNVSSL